MSAIITLPPALIDPVNFSRMTFTEQGGGQGRIMASGGPWFVPDATAAGGFRQYQFLEGGGVLTGVTPLQVFRSVDDGLTWAPMDSASGNAPPTPTNDPSQNTSVFDSVSGRIFVAYMGDGSTHRLRVYTFNTSTDKWESPSVQSTVDSHNNYFVMARLSNGDIYCFYPFVGLSGNTVYEKLSGGVWSTAVVDSSGQAKGVYSVVVDPSDGMTLVYSLAPGGGVNVLKSCHIDSTGAVGSPVTIYTNMSAGFSAGFNVGRGVIWQGTKIVFPAFIYESPFTTLTPIVFEGTPLSAPVWSNRPAGASFTSPPEFNAALDSLLDVTGNLVMGWNETAVPSSIVDKIWLATDSGSGFGAQQLFYDGNANPLNVPGVTVQSGTHSLYLSQTPNGDWFALTAVDMDSVLGFPCGGMYLRTAAPPPAPREVNVIFCGVIRFLLRDRG